MKTQDMVIGAVALLLLAVFMGWVHIPAGWMGTTTTTLASGPPPFATTTPTQPQTTTTFVEAPTSGGFWSELSNACTDSDDGENFMVQGTVQTIRSGASRSYTDKCNDFNTVEEYSCTSDGRATSMLIDCRYQWPGVVRDDFGCAWGKCTNDPFTLGAWRALNQF